MKKRVLIVTCEMLPLPGLPVRGGGLRVWGLGEGLKAAGHEVTYSIPREAVTNDIQLPAEYEKLLHEPETLNDVILEAMPDVVIVEQWGLASFLEDLNIPLVLDLHGPLSLENAFKEGGNFLSDAHTKIDTLAKADLLICPGEFQKQYFLTWFLLAGADPQSAPIEVVPVALGKQTPAHGWPDALRFVFGGVTWPWIDPFPGLEKLAKRVAADKSAVLDLYVGAPPINYNHPLYAINKNIFRDYNERLAGFDRVNIRDFIARDALLKVYAQSSVAYDLYQPNTERQLAFTTRTIEYLWCGLPVIYGNYGELAGSIREYDAGWVVDPADAKALDQVLDEVFCDPKLVRQKGVNAQKLAAERYVWDKAIKPLARFVENPKIREKKSSVLSGFRDYFRKESVSQILEAKNDIAELNAELRRASTQSESDRRERDKKIEDLSNQIKEMILDHDKELKVQAERNRDDVIRKEDDLRRLQEKLDHEVKVRDEEVKRLHVDRQLAEQKAQDELKTANLEKEKLRESMAAELKATIEKKDEELKQVKSERESERTKLQNRVDELVKEMAAEKEKASEEIRSLNKEKEETRKAHEAEVKKLIDKNDTEFTRLKQERETERDKLQARIDDLVKEMTKIKDQASEDIGDLNKEKEETRKAHEQEIKKLIDKNDAELTRLKQERETERDKLQARIDDLVKEMAKIKDQASEDIGDLNREKEETRKAHVQEIKKLVEKAEADLAKIRTEREEETKEALRKLTRETERREDLDRELNAEIKRLNVKIETINEAHTQAMDDLRIRQDEALRKTGEKAEEQISRRDETIVKLNDKIDKLREESEKRIKELDAEKIKLADAHQLTVGKLQTELKELTAQLNKIGNQIEARDEKIKNLDEELGYAKEKALGLEKELQVKLDDNRRLVRELDQLNAEVASKLIDLERVVIEKERYVEESEKRFAQMEDHAAKQKHQIEIINGAMDQLKQDVAKSQQALGDRIADADRLRGDMDKLRRFSRDLEGEVIGLRKKAALQERLLAEFEQDDAVKARRRRVHRSRRWFVQLPKLAYLLTVNLATNGYMAAWQKRTGKKIFPGT